MATMFTSRTMDDNNDDAFIDLTEDITEINEPNTSTLECSICLSELGKIKVTALPCIHCFHTECIKMAFNNSKLCPLCKFDCNEYYIHEEKESKESNEQRPRIRQSIIPSRSFGFVVETVEVKSREEKEQLTEEEEHENESEEAESQYAPVRRHHQRHRPRIDQTFCSAKIANGPKTGLTCRRQRKHGSQFCGYHC